MLIAGSGSLRGARREAKSRTTGVREAQEGGGGDTRDSAECAGQRAWSSRRARTATARWKQAGELLVPGPRAEKSPGAVGCPGLETGGVRRNERREGRSLVLVLLIDLVGKCTSVKFRKSHGNGKGTQCSASGAPVALPEVPRGQSTRKHNTSRLCRSGSHASVGSLPAG